MFYGAKLVDSPVASLPLMVNCFRLPLLAFGVSTKLSPSCLHYTAASRWPRVAAISINGVFPVASFKSRGGSLFYKRVYRTITFCRQKPEYSSGLRHMPLFRIDLAANP
ncbi:hypothetical protein KCP76_19115 [Salmonella enterica subsp. enterica serovar Weltevreden]|nr:hypothetical protein KCP76_19115 [Salmonella enterica subsp. enterica serovar Weltevreden]